VKNYTNEVVTLWFRAPDILLGAKSYSNPIDMWSVGCIFAEMVNLKPLFAGSSEGDQLKKIFKVMGTPSIEKWPGLADLPEWKAGTFEVFPEEGVPKLVPKLDADGLNLLDRMLQYDPAKRITAKEAIEHPYFKGLPDSVKKLYSTDKK